MKVVVFQPWGIGDVLLSIPIVIATKKVFPESEVHFVTSSPIQAELIKNCPHISEIHFLNTANRSIEGMFDIVSFFVSIRRERFDVAIMSTKLSPIHGLLSRVLSGIKCVVGDSNTMSWAFHLHRIPGQEEHRFQRNVALVNLAFNSDIKLTDDLFNIWPDPPSNEAKNVSFSIRSVAFFCGASLEDKALPYDLFFRCATVLNSLYPDIQIVLILGPDDGYTEVPSYVKTIRPGSLSDLAHILMKIGVFIGGDTGPSHIAGFVGARTVVVGGATNINSTLPRNSTFITSNQLLPCRPCYETPLYGNCPYNLKCMTSIEEKQLVDLVIQLLAYTPKYTGK
ncbi:hypothetical protein EB093_09195 [bacterium]|nr:hypothetical protein [bacterium]